MTLTRTHIATAATGFGGITYALVATFNPCDAWPGLVVAFISALTFMWRTERTA